MSDFWEKNKGSIASGLKTAGKYGYQGTKYVAKTGYKASKNANSRRKEREAKKKKHGEDEEEVDDEEYEDHHRGGGSHGRHASPQDYPSHYQQSYQTHPQPYQQPYQPYMPQYQQQPPQQYQQQPQQYQQPQLQYQQPPQQYQQPPQQYQQPPQQYQQPPQQYQQPPQQYQQPPQQYQQPPPPAQPQMTLQQPQQGFQPYSPTNPSQYPDQRFPQDQQLATPLQQPQPGYSNVAAPVGVLSQGSQIPQHLSLRNADEQQGAHQTLGGSSASVYSRSSVSIPETVASSTIHPPPFSRQRVPSPPLPSRTNNAMAPLAEAPMLSSSSGSPVPGVIPYQKEEMEERKRMQRTPIPQVNLSSLPPPPTHKDRGSLEQKESVSPLPHPLSVKTHGEAIGHHVPSPPVAPNRQETSQSPAIVCTSSASEPSVTHSDLPTETENFVQKESVAVERTEPSTSVQNDIDAQRTEISNSVKSVGMRTEGTKSEDLNESRAEGITGKFDYNVKVNYAPPPKPHRSLTATSNASLKQPKTGFSGRPAELNHTAGAPKKAPALPRRQTSGSEILPNATIDHTVSNYLPPPKPHRPTEKMNENENAQLIGDETNPRRGPNSMFSSSDNLASYPPPPRPRRRETSERIPSTEFEELQEDHSSSSTPHARGRLQSLDIEQSAARTNSEASPPKKTPPPPLRPKPKNLSSFGISNDSSNTFTEEKHDAPLVGGEMGDITRELSQFQLRKTGSTLLMDKHDFVNTASPTPNKKRPVIPPKKESLKKAPPVPAKSSFLASGQKTVSDDDATKEDTNPFSVYLKNAVPLENDRLHK